MILSKAAYMEKDLERCRRHFKVPLCMPSVGVSLLIYLLIVIEINNCILGRAELTTQYTCVLKIVGVLAGSHLKKYFQPKTVKF